MAMSIEDVSEGQMKEHESEGALLGVPLYAKVRTIGALTNIVHLHVPARTNDVAESCSLRGSVCRGNHRVARVVRSTGCVGAVKGDVSASAEACNSQELVRRWSVADMF